jgi:hypothetical protein
MQGTVLASHSAQLAPFNTSRTVVRFDPSRVIPIATVMTLVRARADEIRRVGQRPGHEEARRRETRLAAVM